MEIKKKCYFCGDEITTEWVDTVKCRVNGESKFVLICKKCLRELNDDDSANWETIGREGDEDE